MGSSLKVKIGERVAEEGEGWRREGHCQGTY